MFLKTIVSFCRRNLSRWTKEWLLTRIFILLKHFVFQLEEWKEIYFRISSNEWWNYSVRKGDAMDSYMCLFLSILIFVVKYIKSPNRKINTAHNYYGPEVLDLLLHFKILLWVISWKLTRKLFFMFEFVQQLTIEHLLN